MIILNIQQIQDSSVNTMRLSIGLFRNSIFNSNPEKKDAVYVHVHNKDITGIIFCASLT